MALRPVSASFQVRTAVRSKSSFNSCTRWTKLESSGFTLSPPTGASAAAASQERPVLRVQTSARLCWWNSSWFTCARSLHRPGGNTREYAEVYAGNPGEYRQYMRLFNDMVTAVLQCDKPVICRVNGMRVGGGQEVGMACDFSVASDLAVFSQAGPRHGSAPDGGSTDFLPLFVGMERAMASGTLCEPWSAHRFYWLGGLTQIVPALKVDGKWIPNPLVVTDHVLDEYGRLSIGEAKTGDQRAQGKSLLAKGSVDLTLLDEAVDALSTNLLYTMPDCLIKTIESLRKHKLEHWDRNRETNRAWLSLNMMTEARAGFRAFHYGSKEQREVDFILLRRRLAEGVPWSDELIEEIAPWTVQAAGTSKP